MPYVPVQLPYGGIDIDASYSGIRPGFTSQCMNVVPYDAYKGKLRIGQRRPLLGAYEFNDTSPAATRQVQTILRADAYVGSPSVLTQRCIVVAGGEIYVIDDGGTATKVERAAGIAAMKTSGHVGAAVFGQYCYFADGTYYRKIDITKSLADLSNAGTAATTGVLNWSGANGPNNYVVDGAGKFATLLVRFGSRLAMSGVPGASNNWFLSKLNDPEDWKPTTNMHEGISGTSTTEYGKPGEPIVALVPVGESGLLFAGRHTLSYLTADPVVSGARMLELSRSVGIVSERAWCVSDSQTVYMMSQDGLYRVQPNDFQITKSGRVTGGRLDTFFQQQKFNDVNCVLGYDAEGQNVYCLFSRLDLPESSVHLVYSQATDSFWPIQTGWPAFHAPTCCGDFPFGDSRSPVLAFGSSSGYLGWFDRDLVSGVDGQGAVGYKLPDFSPTSDQAAAQRIVSSILMGPVLSPSLSQVMMKDVRIELTMDEPQESGSFASRLSGPFAYVLSGQTAEEAIGENINTVAVAIDPDFPSVTVDCGTFAAFTPSTTYDAGAYNQSWTNATDKALDLLFAPEIAGNYTTSDTLITDPTSRTYTKTSLRVYNDGSAPPSTDWYIQQLTSPTSFPCYRRDTSLPGTSADTPGGTYKYASAQFNSPNSFPLPSDITGPRYTVSSGTYDNTNQNLLGTLVPGRNDAFRCRIRDQAAYVKIESLGVPWAIERMAVLVEPMPHTKNVKGTY
jgi:hypothetical protein